MEVLNVSSSFFLETKKTKLTKDKEKREKKGEKGELKTNN